MPTLPTSFKPVVAGYQFDEPGGVIRTDVAGGSPRYALDWDNGTQRFSVTLILDALQFSVWSAFYHHSIKKGAISFEMPLDSGFGVNLHTVNIAPGSYTAARTGGVMMVVNFVAEAENQVYALGTSGGEALVYLYGEYGVGMQDILSRIAQFANVDSNVL